MPEKIYNVLFLCTGNSVRSIFAEALIGRLGGGRFRGYSAGSHPKGTVDPIAFELLESLGYETAGETCPVWPGTPVTAHWGVPDPAAAEGDEIQRKAAFFSAYRTLERRIGLFASLRIDELDRLALKRSVDEIGRTESA